MWYNKRMWYWLTDLFNYRNFGATRSPRWNVVRKQHLIKEPLCQVCGTKGSFLNPIQVHHCIPVSWDSSKELLFDNLITLCSKDHLIFGHLYSFLSYNPYVRIDSKEWNNKIKNRPKKEAGGNYLQKLENE